MSEPRYTPTPGGTYPDRKRKKPANRKVTEMREVEAAGKKAQKGPVAKIFSVVWKSIIVGIVYTISVIFFGGLVLGIGANLPELNREMEVYLLELFISGAAIAALLGPIHASTKISMNRRFLSISLILFLTSTALLIEETFFRSGTIPRDTLPGLLIQHLLVSVMTGYMIASLFRPRESRRSQPDEEKRTATGWVWRIAASIGSYCLIYYGIAQLHAAVTLHPSFQTLSTVGVVPDAPEFSTVTPIHGGLMLISILPLILMMKSTTAKKMLTGGTVLFIVGGIVPILTKISALPLLLLLLTIAEIFFQDFLSGAITGLLLSKKETEAKEEIPIKKG